MLLISLSVIYFVISATGMLTVTVRVTKTTEVAAVYRNFVIMCMADWLGALKVLKEPL